MKQMRILCDYTNAFANGVQTRITNVNPVYFDRSPLNVVESRHEMSDGRLARARGAHKRNKLAWFYNEVHIMEHSLIIFFVRHCNRFKRRE